MNKLTKFCLSIFLVTLVCTLCTTTALAGGTGRSETEPTVEGNYNAETGGTEASYFAEDGHVVIPTAIVEAYSEKFEIYEQSFYTK